MNDKEIAIPKRINLLKIVEPTLKNKGKAVMLVDYFGSKKSSKNKKKRKSAKAQGDVARKRAKQTTSKGTCFHCGKYDHWKINCKTYLESMKKKAFYATSPSSIFVIKVNNVSQNNQ